MLCRLLSSGITYVLRRLDFTLVAVCVCMHGEAAEDLPGKKGLDDNNNNNNNDDGDDDDDDDDACWKSCWDLGDLFVCLLLTAWRGRGICICVLS